MEASTNSRQINDTRFKPGQITNPNGRPRGTLNRVTVEVREVAHKLISSPHYVKTLMRRINAGEANHMEPILWYYAYGKPVERVESVDGNGNTVSPFLMLVQLVQAAGLTSRDGAERFLASAEQPVIEAEEPESTEPEPHDGHSNGKRPRS